MLGLTHTVLICWNFSVIDRKRPSTLSYRFILAGASGEAFLLLTKTYLLGVGVGVAAGEGVLLLGRCQGCLKCLLEGPERSC